MVRPRGSLFYKDYFVCFIILKVRVKFYGYTNLIKSFAINWFETLSQCFRASSPRWYICWDGSHVETLSVLLFPCTMTVWLGPTEFVWFSLIQTSEICIFFNFLSISNKSKQNFPSLSPPQDLLKLFHDKKFFL